MEREDEGVGSSVEDVGDVELVDMALRLRTEIKAKRDMAEMLEQEIRRRCEVINATVLHGERAVARLKRSSPTYDLARLNPLREAITTEDLDRAYQPEREETVRHPARWNGQQLNRLEREYGGEVAECIRAARIEGPVRLALEPVESDAKR